MRSCDFQGVLLRQHPLADVFFWHLSPLILDYTHELLSLQISHLTFSPIYVLHYVHGNSMGITKKLHSEKEFSPE
jgi:hypothetical protein